VPRAGVGSQGAQARRVPTSRVWLGRLERRLLTFFGPAQVSKVGTQPERSKNRTAGVEGQWVLRRDSTGRTYLVSAADDDPSADPDSPPAG
jgi:hypothetical protein